MEGTYRIIEMKMNGYKINGAVLNGNSLFSDNVNKDYRVEYSCSRAAAGDTYGKKVDGEYIYLPRFSDGISRIEISRYDNVTQKTHIIKSYSIERIEDLEVRSDELITIYYPEHTRYVSFSGTRIDNLVHINTANFTDMSSMFFNCSELRYLSLSGWDTTNVTNMSYMFSQCSNLKGSLDLTCLNTSKVVDMSYMFYSCNLLESVNLSGWDVKKVESLKDMFAYCYSITSIDFTSWNTRNLLELDGMFFECNSIETLDVPFNTKKVTNTSYTFYKCSSLKYVNVNMWDTRNVTTMESMFFRCSSLTRLDFSMYYASDNVPLFSVDNVTNMYYMFNGCSKLEYLYLQKWNTGKVKDYGYMLSGVSANVSVGSNWTLGTDVESFGGFNGKFTIK